MSVDAGALVGLAVLGEVIAVAPPDGRPIRLRPDEVAAFDERFAPRWAVWSCEDLRSPVTRGMGLDRCWDVAAVHRLQHGGWRTSPGAAWAWAHGIDPAQAPEPTEPDLFTSLEAGDPDEPVQLDGHLRAAWVDGPERLGRWAELAREVAVAQVAERDGGPSGTIARSESTSGLLCVELERSGLPIDRATMRAILEREVGPRPRDEDDRLRLAAERDGPVLDLVPDGPYDLRNPAKVRSLLRRVGLEVPDTRAWRLETMRDAHPVVDELLRWRKAERLATTYGYEWLDEHVGEDGRLRGTWHASDGAAGRMTASAGLHSLPAVLRPAVVAEPGHVLVRADLGQIEPRVLAAVSGDAVLAEATRDDDLYAPVARQLGVDRETAKVAVLGAMYGQTTGHGAQALRGLERSYPVAMGLLQQADHDGQAARDVITHGGRRVRMGDGSVEGLDDRVARSRAAARGRFARNAVVQGAAAELFKLWAVLVRTRTREHGAEVVLCLHDELLVHTPAESGDVVAASLDACLREAAARLYGDAPVRFLADTSVIRSWADAKG